MRFEKKVFFVVLAALFGLLSFSSKIFAESGPPPLLNYQGVLNDDAGSPVTGEKTMSFKIYATIDAAPADALWTSNDKTVQVEAGRFSVVLGETTPFPTDLFSDSARYLGVTVSGAELVPRKRLLSVPYAMNCGIPQGAIVMWSGTVANIPAGWGLCDGTNGTPNLRDRFIVGAGGGYTVGKTGGASSHNLAHTHTVNSHNHSINSDGNHNHSYSGTVSKSSDSIDNVRDGDDKKPTDRNHNHTYSGTTSTNGSHNHGGATGNASPETNSQLSSIENRPLFYALCFIMKK